MKPAFPPEYPASLLRRTAEELGKPAKRVSWFVSRKPLTASRLQEYMHALAWDDGHPCHFTTLAGPEAGPPALCPVGLAFAALRGVLQGDTSPGDAVDAWVAEKPRVLIVTALREAAELVLTWEAAERAQEEALAQAA